MYFYPVFCEKCLIADLRCLLKRNLYFRGHQPFSVDGPDGKGGGSILYAHAHARGHKHTHNANGAGLAPA